MVLNGTCDPDQMNGRTEKRRKERRNEAKMKTKGNEGMKERTKEWLTEWRNESMKEPMMEGKEPHHLIRTTTCYFFNRPCKDSFISTWLTLSVFTGKIWHILSLGQISIEVLYLFSKYHYWAVYAFFSLRGIMASIKFLKYLVWQSTKAKDNHIGIRKKERKNHFEVLGNQSWHSIGNSYPKNLWHDGGIKEASSEKRNLHGASLCRFVQAPMISI